ncbi:MAG: hypothetical protein WC314_20845 [Vulcanimicrobiota bacterium]
MRSPYPDQAAESLILDSLQKRIAPNPIVKMMGRFSDLHGLVSGIEVGRQQRERLEGILSSDSLTKASALYSEADGLILEELEGLLSESVVPPTSRPSRYPKSFEDSPSRKRRIVDTYSLSPLGLVFSACLASVAVGLAIRRGRHLFQPKGGLFSIDQLADKLHFRARDNAPGREGGPVDSLRMDSS